MEEKIDTSTETMTHWEKVVDLVRADFWGGCMVEEATWQSVVLIPKGKGTTASSASWRWCGR